MMRMNEEMVIEVDDVDETAGNVELCIVGRFLMDQTTNFKITHSRMSNIWSPKKGVRLLCQFYHAIDVQRVLDAFIGAPLESGRKSFKVSLYKIHFWLSIDNIPMGLFTERIGRMLGNFIGHFLEYDRSKKGSVWLNFIRFKVELDVTKPLKC